MWKLYEIYCSRFLGIFHTVLMECLLDLLLSSLLTSGLIQLQVWQRRSVSYNVAVSYLKDALVYILTLLFHMQVKNPQRDLPLGIGLSLLLCCLLYMMVSVVIVGLVPYYAMDFDTPISSAFASHGIQWAA